jgi:hypothetical protein
MCYTNDFVEHFKNISNTMQNDFSFDDVHVHEVRYEEVNIVELDRPFDIEEVTKTIASKNRGKSCGYERNVADFFIDSNSFISPYLVSIFDKIYDSGLYPEAWCKGIIVPIHKKAM